MTRNLRVGGFPVAAFIFVVLLAGCRIEDEGSDGIWTYDFIADGDIGESGEGYWLNQATIAAPYLFTGDLRPRSSST